MSTDHVRIVLVNTTHPGNIGATARAMKNMGLEKLSLVNPKDYPSIVALARASSALDILDNAVITENLAEAISDCSLVIGASARHRSMPVPVINPAQCAELSIEAGSKNKVALVFGREDSGLTNEELLMCHYHVQIPANPEYSSLNVATAVMVLAYEIRKQLDEPLAGANSPRPIKEEHWDQKLATSAEVESFLAHLEKVLIQIGFHNPDAPRQLMARMRRLYNRINLDQLELNMLRGMLSAVEESSAKPADDADSGDKKDITN